MARILVTARSVAGVPQALRQMEAAGHEVVVATTPVPFDKAWLLAQVREADALVLAMEPMDAEVIAAAPKLRLIARPGVGFDNVDLDAATRAGVVVTVARGTNDASVADFTFALMLEAMRGTSVAAQGVREGRWERVTGTELWRKTIAVVGLGPIGLGVVRRARGFEMRVLAVNRSRDDALAQREGFAYAALDDAVEQADIVSLHLPLLQQTANLFDAGRLARMKPGAFLINTARGGLVDERALAAAVRQGRLAGAAADVLQVQGANSPSPLIGVPGIVVTPHMATFTHESMARVAMSVAGSVIDVLAGRRPAHAVNPEALERAAGDSRAGPSPA